MNDMRRDTIGPAAAAVHIACADLLLAGYRAMIAPEGLHYDIVLDAGGGLYRIQVKSASRPGPRRRGAPSVYRFATTRNHRPSIHGDKADIRHYSDSEIDIIACVAIDIRTVAYFRVVGKFVGGIHLYPAGTAPWVRDGISQRRMIDAFPIASALKHQGPPTLAYGP